MFGNVLNHIYHIIYYANNNNVNMRILVHRKKLFKHYKALKYVAKLKFELEN